MMAMQMQGNSYPNLGKLCLGNAAVAADAGLVSSSDGPEGRRKCARRYRAWGYLKRRPAAQTMLLMCLFLMWGRGGGDEIAELQAAQLRLANTFDLRKQLSGESTYPSRYRSTETSTGQCCGGDKCTECQSTKVGNLDAVRIYLDAEIRLLKKLGCPCRIEQLMPSAGAVSGGTEVVVTVSALDIDLALARGPIDCWIRMGLEEYVVRPTSRVSGVSNQLRCRTPPSAPQDSQITLHATDFAITDGSTKFTYYDFRAPSLFSIVPSGAPSTLGGLALTLTGAGFQASNLPIFCVFELIPFISVVKSNETAVCITPSGLPATKGKLYVSFNAREPAGTQTLDFAVYHQPQIVAIWPSAGYGNEAILIQARGLAFTYDPREDDLRCAY
jgi:hypothetical protein